MDINCRVSLLECSADLIRGVGLGMSAVMNGAARLKGSVLRAVSVEALDVDTGEGFGMLGVWKVL